MDLKLLIVLHISLTKYWPLLTRTNMLFLRCKIETNKIYFIESYISGSLPCFKIPVFFISFIVGIQS